MEGLEYGTTTMVIALEHWKKVRFPLLHGLNVNIYAKNLHCVTCFRIMRSFYCREIRQFLMTIHSNFLKLIAYLKN